MFGFDPFRAICSIKGLPTYFRDLKELKSQRASAMREFPLGQRYPCLGDRFSYNVSAKEHYFHQDLLVAGRINLNSPQRHIDIGSRIDGFVAHVAAFRAIEIIDIRPLSNNIPNVIFRQADLMATIQESLRECCDSLSCLHALGTFSVWEGMEILYAMMDTFLA